MVHNAAVQHSLSTVSPDSNPTIVVLQKDAWLVSKDNFILFRRQILLSSHHWRRRRLWFCLKGRPSNGRLADSPLAVNDVEWYAQTLNDALQTQCAVLGFVM
ncbi:hypothetical protein TNCV_2353321 [Trichonephila clavipes]|nr:hypothetical protein TNCV_2353321 [Trichonephila clavipes]